MTDVINDLHWAAFRRHLRTKNRSDHTIRTYHQAITDLRAYHHDRDLAELSQVDIEEYIEARLSELKATTVGIRFRHLRALYNWMVREEIVEGRSPMAGMSEPSVTDSPPPIIDDADLRLLLRTCDGKSFEDRRDTAIIRLFCEPGSPRVSAMAGILVADLDTRRDMVRVRDKGDKVRDIPFGAKTGQALDRYLRVRAKHSKAWLPNLWLGGRGAAFTVSGIAQMLGRRAADAGIGHVHPHQLRHTAAHVWADNGGSESDAMELFGWSSPEMPRRYGRSARTARAQRAAKRASLGDRL